MKSPTTDNRSAHAARAVLETRGTARMQDASHAEELENSRRLREARGRQEQEELVRKSTNREWRDAGNTTLSGLSH